MRRLSALRLLLCLLPATAFCQQADSAAPNQIVHVATALNHLTVLEFHEPVALAAAGSSDFQIEREANKVFVKPIKAGMSTDLFVWTATRRFAYELETTEEVKKMNFTIDSNPPETQKPVPSVDADQLADLLLTRALLGAEQITPPRSKPAKKQVNVVVEQVFRTRSTIYVHYRIANNTNRIYQPREPEAQQLQPDPSKFAFLDFLHSQLDGPMVDRLGSVDRTPLPVPHSENELIELEPGQTTQGAVAIREDLKSPAMIELDFSEGVKAIVVL